MTKRFIHRELSHDLERNLLRTLLVDHCTTGPLGDRGSGKVIFQSSRRRRSPLPPPFPFGSKEDDLRRNFFSVLATERASPPFLPSSAQSLPAAVPKGGGGGGRHGRRRCEREINGEIWPPRARNGGRVGTSGENARGILIRRMQRERREGEGGEIGLAGSKRRQAKTLCPLPLSAHP